MRGMQRLERRLLAVMEKLLPAATFDRAIINRRRKINHITGYYPQAVFFSAGKSREKYCIVRYAAPTMELMAAGIQYIFCYHKLVQRGYIPIIDIEYAYSYIQGRLGESNIWDICFKQPLTVKETAKQPYVLAAGELFSYSDDAQICQDLNGNSEDHFIHVRKENFREYYARAKSYTEPIWQVRDDLIRELEEEIWNRMAGRRILGVFLRENFSEDVSYEDEDDKAVYSRHPLLPGVKETIGIIKNQLSEWKYDLIYLSTQYINSLEQFRDEFGDKVVCIERERTDIYVPQVESWGLNEKETYKLYQPRQAEREERTRNYLKEIVLLSRCDYLIGGASSGMAAALVMNGGKYDDIYILEDKRKIQRY